MQYEYFIREGENVYPVDPTGTPRRRRSGAACASGSSPALTYTSPASAGFFFAL